MELAWYIYPLAIVAGIVAGIINTLAGSGSAVTLPMMDLMGLPAPMANATNRIGIILQNVVGLGTYRSSGNLKRSDLDGGNWLIGASAVGSILGTYIATLLGKRQMELAIGIVMIIILITIFYNPKKWLRDSSEVPEGRPSLMTLGMFFVIGAYGGFIQAGVGVFLLTALVLSVGYSMKQANIIKLVIILVFSVVALAVFFFSPVQINWGVGFLLGIGQMIGAWAGATFAVKVPSANVWVRRLLIVVVVYSIFRYLGLLDLIIGLF